MWAAAGALFKAIFGGFVDSILSALRRRRQDRELAEGEQRKAENKSLKHAQEASKKARKVDEKIENSSDTIDSLLDDEL